MPNSVNLMDIQNPWETYTPPAPHFDEMFSQMGQVRSHWTALAESIGKMGIPELQQRHQAIRAQLKQNGVTYHIYDDPAGIDRLWGLDLIPILFNSTEWSQIEQGILQRAELLNLVLQDLYGEQKLITQGILPPEIVFTRAFLRPCHGTLTHNRALFIYGADLVRSPEGQVWVINDRTQNPSGMGYSLENRLILSRVLPSIYREAQAHRLSLFFRSFRASLRQLLPHHNSEELFVVVLSPGPENETYFEHAFLANYLKFFLVQGGDLVVQGQTVWFRSMKGLQKVDVIIRRVDDDYCDSLEFRGDSLLGVPGLMQAVRAQNVAVVNPLGSGVLQNLGLLSYLPVLSRYFLNEELRLPSVPTWWCGDVQMREYVIEKLDELVIRTVTPTRRESPIFGKKLSKKQRVQLVEKIRANPRFYVGQKQIDPSTVPSFRKGRLEPRRFGLRTFSIAREHDYMMMPGGLAQVAAKTDSVFFSGRYGGVSKDIWVIASEPEQPISLMSNTTSHKPARHRLENNISQRSAEGLFWIGRYNKRAESVVRLMREVVSWLIENPSKEAQPTLHTLLRSLTHQTRTYPGFIFEEAEEELATPFKQLHSILWDESLVGSIRFNVKAIIHAAQTIRDQVSRDLWTTLHMLDQDPAPMHEYEDLLEYLELLVTRFAAIRGICMDSMTHEIGWRFWDMGRRFEWALSLLSFLQALAEEPDVDDSVWESLLCFEDSQMIYRNRYTSELYPNAVLELVLKDTNNPRSVMSQLQKIQEHIMALTPENQHRMTREERLLLEAISSLHMASLNSVAEEGYSYQSFKELYERLVENIQKMADAIGYHYFQPQETPQSLELLA